MFATAGLHRGLLVAADDVVAGVQQLAFPTAGVEVKDAACLLGEVVLVCSGGWRGGTRLPAVSCWAACCASGLLSWLCAYRLFR